MATARETIAGALRLIGVKGSGETLDSTEDSELLVVFNDLLEEFTAEGLLTHQRTFETLSWASGNASRTIGATGNLVTPRPVKVETAFIRDGGVDYPLDIISAQEYQEIGDKASTSNIPTHLHINPTFPNATAYLWPVPSQDVTLGLSSVKPFTAHAIGDDLAYPPGYNKTLKYCLAVELAPEYGKEVPLAVFQKAEELKDALRRQNLAVPKVKFEGIPAGDDYTFDIERGW